MAPVVQQPQNQKDPLHLTITPGALVEQTGPGSATPVFADGPITVTPDGIRTLNDASQCPPTTNNRSGSKFSKKPVQNEAISQTWFENAVKKKLNLPNGYDKVAVLVIRWDDDLDDPRFRAGHDREVKRLKQVFGERFGYDVSSEVRLNTSVKPQHTLNKAIGDHIHAFDGPNNLLIIYYTGHGSLYMKQGGEPQLQLAATINSHDVSQDSIEATAIWGQAEKPLRKSVDADVLTLLDCCYAGNAHKGLNKGRRTYELLAACHRDQITVGPGRNSFTTRLLDALEHLLDNPEDPPIIMTRLEEVINNRSIASTHDSKPAQNPNPVVLLDRLNNHIGRHVQLAPLRKRTKEENKRFQPRPQEKSVVQLLFSLEVEELSKDQIEVWAEELSKLRHPPAGIPISRIDWMKVEDRRMTKRWKDVLDFAQTQNKKRKSIPGGSSSDGRSPSAKRRTQDDLLSPRDTQGQLPPTPGNSDEDGLMGDDQGTS